LSALKVERAKTPGLWADGGGLYLRVAEGGSKQWIFRYATNGRQRDMGIGPAHTVSLAQAREKARDARLLRLEGVDPIESKRARMAALRAADARAMTFADCTRGYIKDKNPTGVARDTGTSGWRRLAGTHFPCSARCRSRRSIRRLC
jgi:hypothetical protein